jgi:hypothetical protein
MFSSLKMLCSPRAVIKCDVANGRPAYMGGLSPALCRLICTGPPCRKRHKYWRPQNISTRFQQDFTDFGQTIAVNISAHKRPIKNQKLVKAKSNHNHCPISVFLLITSIQRPSQRPTSEPLSCPKWGMGVLSPLSHQGEGGLCCEQTHSTSAPSPKSTSYNFPS